MDQAAQPPLHERSIQSMLDEIRELCASFDTLLRDTQDKVQSGRLTLSEALGIMLMVHATMERVRSYEAEAFRRVGWPPRLDT